MMIENFIKCPGLGNLGVGMYDDVINLDGTTVSFKSSASQKRRSTLERTEANYIS